MQGCVLFGLNVVFSVLHSAFVTHSFGSLYLISRRLVVLVDLALMSVALVDNVQAVVGVPFSFSFYLQSSLFLLSHFFFDLVLMSFSGLE